MFESIDDARLEIPGHLLNDCWAEIAPHDIAAKGEGEPGVLVPPFSQVSPKVETPVGEGQLTLMDQQAHIHLSPQNRVLDRVERQHNLDEFGLVELQGEIRRGELAWNPYPKPTEGRPGIRRSRRLRNEPRPVAISIEEPLFSRA